MAGLHSMSTDDLTLDQASARSSISQNDDYVTHMPAPPQLPMLRPLTAVNLLHGYVPPTGTPVPAFLNTIDVRSFFQRSNDSLNWKYSHRYCAQMILPYLWLGPRTVAKDLSFINQAGISLIVLIRHADPEEAKPPPQMLLNAKQDQSLELCILDVKSSQALISTFSQAAEAIDTHLLVQNLGSTTPKSASEIKGAVLVCCDAGTELSASVAIAYMMHSLGVDLPRALRYVQDQRFCISITQHTSQILQSYDEILAATRDVAGQSSSDNNNSNLLGRREVKRPRDDSDDVAMAYNQCAQDPSPTGRRDFAPFSQN